MGKKYEDFFYRKSAKIRGKRWKRGGQKRKLSLYFGEKHHFGKGGGAKISIIWIINTPDIIYIFFTEIKQITLDSLHLETTIEDVFIKNEIYIIKLDILTLTVEIAKKLLLYIFFKI